jgi:hypothetical protein
MAPGIILLFFGIVGMFTDTFAGATTPVSAVAKALAVCVITLFLLHYMGRWTSRALDIRFVRRFSQFL